MRQKIVQKENKKLLNYVNPDIRICIVCGYDKIESYEHGVSCEDCGTFFGRVKC